MPEPIRLALIGCGGIMNAFHIPRFVADPEVTIVALVEPDQARLEQARAKTASLTDVPAYADHRTMLRQVQPDAVVIATPHSAHCRQIVDTLNAGAHVMVEKPMVNAVAEARRVIAARDAAQKIVLVSYQRHFQSTFLQIKQLIADGSLGAVQFITALQDQPWQLR